MLDARRMAVLAATIAVTILVAAAPVTAHHNPNHAGGKPEPVATPTPTVEPSPQPTPTPTQPGGPIPPPYQVVETVRQTGTQAVAVAKSAVCIVLRYNYLVCGR